MPGPDLLYAPTSATEAKRKAHPYAHPPPPPAAHWLPAPPPPPAGSLFWWVKQGGAGEKEAKAEKDGGRRAEQGREGSREKETRDRVSHRGRLFVPEGVECQRVEREGGPVRLVQSCIGLDSTAEMVAHSKGGSSYGYNRWARFVREGLGQYARRRNNACQRTAVSRMSAYLHYGET
eukprot:3160089-Rhodomonas_salina.1